MEVKVERFIFSKNYTMSRVYVNAELFSFGLEPYDASINSDTPVDTILELKAKYGKIAIPVGTYNLIYNWSNTYKKKLPLVLDTPGFVGVRVHSGNTVDDTRACLLLGKFYTMGHISESRKTCAKFEELLKKDKTNTITYAYGSERQFI